MIPEKEKRALLDRIEQSSSLSSSSTYSRLLQFLVNCTLSETIPKEQAIAEHLFGKSAVQSDTSKIRVYVYHLRKKLKQYFENEGKTEAYTLSIPKGAYKVEFKKNDHSKPLPFTSLNQKYVLFSLLGLLFCSVLVNFFLFFSSKNDVPKAFINSSFWADYFENDKPIQVIVGDLFIFSEVDSITGEVRNIRMPDINSPAQFDAYRNAKENKGKVLKEMTYTHLLKGAQNGLAA